MTHNRDKAGPKRAGRSTRITVTLPPENYELLVRMAKNRKVSASWMVRDAVDKYLSADAPLLKLTAAS
jgi:metal-responsive CopG/Arc/MetJ family transcriptional regulator